MIRPVKEPLNTIRFRLAGALGLALLPVLLLGALQAALAYGKDGESHRLALASAAERAAATVRAGIENTDLLLRALALEPAPPRCAQSLARIGQSIKNHDVLMRFGATGGVVCASHPSTASLNQAGEEWFSRLRQGRQSLAVSAPRALNRGEPAMLIAERLTNPAGSFDGAMVAVVNLNGLRPDLHDPALPEHTVVALADRAGRFITQTDVKAFAPLSEGLAWFKRAGGSLLYYGDDRRGEPRVYAAAPLNDDLSLILSAPRNGLFTWAQLNPLSSIIFPLLAFIFALGAVWVVTERVVIRWLHYLQRIADIYAGGRFTVRAVRVQAAPPEIQNMAHALESMADAIVVRDNSLRDSIIEKDALMREIHHRVKNNLQVISSLINMQRRNLIDPIARDALSDTGQRIAALALIYRSLYQGPDLKRVDIRQFLGDLLAQMVTEPRPHGGTVSTELEADELIIDPDKLAPFALFAVEAISNAQKHALSIKGGVLKISFTVHGDEAELRVADEGGGETLSTLGEGVGRTLMAAFARQLRGRMELALNDRGGVTAQLIFPTGAETGPRRIKTKFDRPSRNAA